MLDAIKAFFDQHIAPSPGDSKQIEEHRARVAVSALLAEVVRMKVTLIEHMWRVAYADRTIHKYEDHLIRKIADLLYVPHAEFIAAKHRVLEEDAEKGRGL